MSSAENGATQMAKRCRVSRIMSTIACFCGYFTMGVGTSILGPTLVNLQVLLGVDTRTISWAIIGRSIGTACGTAVAGFVLSKVNDAILFSALYLAFGLSTALCPVTDQIVFFAVMLTVQGAAFGTADAAGQAYVLNRWSGHKRSASIYQMIYAIWAVGTAIGPLIIIPFLSDVGTEALLNASSLATNYTNETGDLANTLTEITMNDTYRMEDANRIIYGYILAGSLTVVPMALFIASLRCGGYASRLHEHTVDQHAAKRETPKDSTKKKFETVFRSFAGLIIFSYALTNTSLLCFLSIYCVKTLGWSTEKASLIMSAYLFPNMFIKLLMIFLYAWLTPRTVLYMSTSTMLLAYGLFPASKLNHVIPWISAALAGMGQSVVQSALFLWCKQYISITPRTVSFLMSCSSTAVITSPLLFGFLFDHFGTVCVPYVLLAGCISLVTFLIVTDVIQKIFKQEKLKETIDDQTINVPLHESNLQEYVEQKCAM